MPKSKHEMLKSTLVPSVVRKFVSFRVLLVTSIAPLLRGAVTTLKFLEKNYLNLRNSLVVNENTEYAIICFN
jgi:hypothetical protein